MYNSAFDAFMVSIVMGIWILIAAYAYKCRGEIKTWLDTPRANAPYRAENDRELALKRQVEDANRELAWLEAHKKKE